MRASLPASLAPCDKASATERTPPPHPEDHPMLTPPLHPKNLDVLTLVKKEWLPEADHAEYLPVGFGAHHWRVDAAGRPLLFVTLDAPDKGPFPTHFEEAYTTASHLGDTSFAHVVAPLRSHSGYFTVPCATGLLSACPWVDGRTPSADEARTTAHVYATMRMLKTLHHLPPPTVAPVWAPRIGLGVTARLTAASTEAWTRGPLGEQARNLVTQKLEAIREWEARYAELVRVATDNRARWALTHGEPHFANQLVTESELLLVDWATCAIAPIERDVRTLPVTFHDAWGADPAMLELFDLEWQLSEIQEYAQWFRQPHTGADDDLLAIDGLRDELAG